MKSYNYFLNENSSSVRYTGVFFDDKIVSKLLSNVSKEMSNKGIEVPNWKTPKDHHVTITMGELPLGMKVRGDVGSTVKVKVTELGVSDKSIAVKVDMDYPSKNDIPHITIYYKDKAVESNYIKNWTKIKPFTIEGEIKEMK